MNRFVFAAVFATGLLALAWVGSGFVGTSGLALLMTGVIASVYLLGALELQRFRATTAALGQALTTAPVAAAPSEPSSGDLTSWLQQVPQSLRHAVRLRVEGERTPLPGPALTPYLVGLLVMLGMLGTFLGMVVTFKGAVFALEGSADLQAIRSALAAPIKGLGLSFGTSVAGVATSAALGLLSALSRRERMEVARQLDHQIATTLRPWSLAHQRAEALKAQQAQALALPQVADQLRQLIEGLEQRNQAHEAALQARQDAFHRDVSQAYTALAASVGTALRDSLAASAQAASESLRPAMASALQGIAQASQQLHERQIALTQAQLQGVVEAFSTTAHTVSEGWTAALHTQERSSQALAQRFEQAGHALVERMAHTSDALVTRLDATSHRLGAGLEHAIDHLTSALDTRIHALVGQVQETLVQSQAHLAQADTERLHSWQTQLQDWGTDLQQAWQAAGQQALAQQQATSQRLEAASADIAERTSQQARDTLAALQQVLVHSDRLLQARTEAEARWSDEQHERMTALTQLCRHELSALRTEEAERGQAAVQRLGAMQGLMADHLRSVQDTLSAAQEAQTQADQQRLAAWTAEQHSLASTWQDQWQRTATETLQQQQAVCLALETTAGDIARRVGQQANHTLQDMARVLAQAEALVHTRIDSEAAWEAQHHTRMDALANLWRTELTALREQEAGRGEAAVARLAELQSALAQHIAQLGNTLEAPLHRVLQTASAVPEAAAQVIVQLREESTRLTERDNQALHERAAVLQQISGLVESLQQAAQAQQTAVQSLVSSAASALGQTGEQVAQTLHAQAAQAADVAAQVSGTAIELSSLGESFHHGVQLFSASSDRLLDSLQRIETALQQSMARSDDQLAYYVGQAREVIDLSISAQQTIVEDLRRMHPHAAVAAGATA